MITRGITTLLILVFASVAIFTACDVMSDKGVEESLDKVPKVTAIDGAQNATIRVNKGTNSNFDIDIQNVEWNNLISNGEREAYCIAPKTPISSNNAIYEGVGVYSTAGDEQFADINRLFSIKSDLMKNDPELTWREIQVAVWVMAPFQEFDMNMPVNELPAEVRSNGQPNFDKGKVQDIVDLVRSRSSSKSVTSFEGSLSSTSNSQTTMCVIGTDSDTQTLIVKCDETAYAYGGNNVLNTKGQAGYAGDGLATCFPDVTVPNPTENKWGWTNGGITPGYDNSDNLWPIYAGAGQCKITGKPIVGTLGVQYYMNSGDYYVDVTYNLHTSLFDIEPGEDFTSLFHVYVGFNSVPPSGNFAPGNYYKEGDSAYLDRQIVGQDNVNLTVTYRYSIPKPDGGGAPGAIWVIAHIGD